LRVLDWPKSWTAMVIDWDEELDGIGWPKSWAPRRPRAISCPPAAAAGILITAPAPTAWWAGALVLVLKDRVAVTTVTLFGLA
jgi:hypothetical protein